MAFVNEKISLVDQKNISYDQLKNPHGERSLVGTPWWTVDREHNAFLIGLGGGVTREDYVIPFYFLFSLQGMRMRVDALQKRRPSDDPKLGVLTWEVTKLQLPEKFSIPLEEIMQFLTEALVAYGNTGTEWGHLTLKTVNVDFSKLRRGM